MVEWLIIQLHILEFPVSNLRPETGYPELRFRDLPHSPGECRDSTLKLGHGRFIPNPLQFFFYVSPFHTAVSSLSY
jgi:hypothetical protein